MVASESVSIGCEGVSDGVSVGAGVRVGCGLGIWGVLKHWSECALCSLVVGLGSVSFVGVWVSRDGGTWVSDEGGFLTHSVSMGLQGSVVGGVELSVLDQVWEGSLKNCLTSDSSSVIGACWVWVPSVSVLVCSLFVAGGCSVDAPNLGTLHGTVGMRWLRGLFLGTGNNFYTIKRNR